MEMYKINKVSRIYISVFILLICIGNAKAQDYKQERDFFRKENRILNQQTTDMIEKHGMKEIWNWSPNQEINLPKSKLDIIDDYITDESKKKKKLQTELQKSIGDLKKEKKKTAQQQKEIDALQDSLKTIEKQLFEIDLLRQDLAVLRTACNAWIAFNDKKYDEAFRLFLSSDDLNKGEGASAFQNIAKELKRKLGCHPYVKELLLKAQKLNNTQEITNLITECN